MRSQNISATRKDRRLKIQAYAAMERLMNAAGCEGKRGNIGAMAKI